MNWDAGGGGDVGGERPVREKRRTVLMRRTTSGTTVARWERLTRTRARASMWSALRSIEVIDCRRFAATTDERRAGRCSDISSCRWVLRESPPSALDE